MAVAPRMYARSLFQAAKETGKLDVAHAELGEFAAAVDEVPELRGLLSNPQIESDERAAALRAILAQARSDGEAQRERAREEVEADRQRRLEDTRKQIEAETVRALEQIRSEVADLTLIATQKVTSKVLDKADHKKLIDDAIGELDFSALETEKV